MRPAVRRRARHIVTWMAGAVMAAACSGMAAPMAVATKTITPATNAITTETIPGYSRGCVAVHAVPTAAEVAMQTGELERAAVLYREALAETPDDAALTVGLARVLLLQQKVNDADALVSEALQSHPENAQLLTAKAEVQYRQGRPWLAEATAKAAMKADPCVARLHYLQSRIETLNSNYATAMQELEAAHTLDPADAVIHDAWIAAMPIVTRIQILNSEAQASKDEAEQARLEQKIDALRRLSTVMHKPCRLQGEVETTELPLVEMEILAEPEPTYVHGLNININGHAVRLMIDTGADGLVVKRSLAERAGLEVVALERGAGGIGDEEEKDVYRAYAERIQIGGLTFQDCAVHVVDNSRMPEVDGLIGLDVMSQFLVSLDYPAHMLRLQPLPPRPGETATMPALGTERNPAEEDAATQLHDAYVAPEMSDYTHVYRYGQMLMMPVLMNQKKTKLFVLDTGAMQTTVSSAAAGDVTPVMKNSKVRVYGINGQVREVNYAIQLYLQFGGLSQLLIKIPAIDTSSIDRGLGMEIAGFLGSPAMLKSTLRIDYRDGLVKFDRKAK